MRARKLLRLSGGCSGWLAVPSSGPRYIGGLSVLFGLKVATDPAWLRVVLSDLDAFLVDHAAAERKASGMAMQLVSHYPDRPELVSAMVDLACEELEHFRLVYRVIEARGVQLVPDTRDEYVRGLQALSRRGREAYFMDRLLIAGIVEARGCERFGLVAGGLPPGKLKDLYAELTRAESRHHGLFMRMARTYFDQDKVALREQELLEQEAQIVAGLSLRAALH